MNKIICILGMHRSGTSLAAQILAANGVSFGNNILGKRISNPEGHYEDRFILNTNKRILRDFNSSWDRPNLDIHPPLWPFFCALRPDGYYWSDLYFKIKENIPLEYFTHRPFAFKDPRCCITLPFWKEVFNKMTYLVVLRHQDAVAQSLLRRQQQWLSPSRVFWRAGRYLYGKATGTYEPIRPMTREKALWLWKYYNDRIVEYTKDEETVVVTHEQLLRDPHKTIHFTLFKLGICGILNWKGLVKESLVHSEKHVESPEEMEYYHKLTGR